jgi:hypothetical protein
MGIVAPWAVVMALQAYKHGIQPKQMPEPFWFFWATAAFGVAGLVAMGNERLGTVLAWGLLVGSFVYSYQSQKTKTEQAVKNSNPSAQQIVGSQPFNPFQNRSSGTQAI